MNKVKIYFYDSEDSPWLLEDSIKIIEDNRGWKCVKVEKLKTDTKMEALCYFVEL